MFEILKQAGTVQALNQFFTSFFKEKKQTTNKLQKLVMTF